MIGESLKPKVLAFLQKHHQPVTSRAVADALDLDAEAVQYAVCLLAIDDLLKHVGRDGDGKPLYVSTEGESHD